MRLDTSNLSPSVTRALREFYRRRRIYACARFLLGGLILGSVLALAAMHADRFLFLTQSLRMRMLLLVGAATAVYILVGLATFFLGRSRARDVAYDLERQLPADCQERLVSAESLSRELSDAESPVQKQLAENLRVFAEDYARQLRSASLAKDPKLRHRAIGILVLAAVCAALFAAPGYQFDLMVQRFFRPSANLPKPSFVSIEIEPENIQVGSGGETVIRANVTGEVPGWLQWLYQKLDIRARQCLIASQDGEQERLEFEAENSQPMSRVRKDLFINSRTDLEESFSFQVRYADAQTKVRFAEVVPHPDIRKLRIRVQPPEYTELPEQTYEEVGDALRVYPESEVTVEFWVDQAVPRRIIEINNQETVEPEWNKDERKGTWSFEFNQELEAAIKVENAKGFPNKRGGSLAFAVREDQEPNVELESPRGTVSVVPGELLPVRGAITDDLKVKEAVLTYILNPDTDRSARNRSSTIKIDPENQGEVEFVKLFDLQETGMAPGDVLQFHIRARDSGGNDGESQTVTVHARSFARGAHEQRRVQALRFVDQALPVLTQARDEELSENRIRNDLADLVDRWDEVESAPTSMSELLDVLEREHHFSDAPMDKEGTRRLAFMLAAAAGGNEAVPSLDALRRGMLLPWLRHRHHRNLTWRYFGLHREALELAERIRERMTAHNQHVRRVRSTLVESVVRTVERVDENEDLQQPIRDMVQLRREIQSVNRDIREAEQEGQNDNMGGMGGGPTVVTEEQEADNELFQKRRELREKLDDVRDEFMRSALTIARELLEDMEYGEEAEGALGGGEFREFFTSAVEDALDEREAEVAEIARNALNEVYTSEKAEEGAITRRLRRRASVFFDILQDTGGEMLKLAAESDLLDGEVISDLQQDINVGARQVSGGDSASAERRCRETAQNLADLLQDHLVHALPDTARQSQQALAELESEYRQQIQRLFDTPEEWARDALARDGRMLQLDPFALSPRDAARNLILRDQQFGGEERPQMLESSILDSPLAGDERSREARALRKRGLLRWDQWQKSYLEDLDELSNDEHRIANALRALELALHVDDRTPAIGNLSEYLGTFEMGDDEPPADTEFAAMGDVDEPAASLAESIMGELATYSVEEPILQLAEELGDEVGRLSEAQQSIQNSENAESPTSIFAEMANQLASRNEQYTLLIDLLRLQIAYVGSSDTDRELLYLALREHHSGWRARGMTIVDQLKEESEDSSEDEDVDTAALFPLLTRLTGQLEALSDNVRAAGEEYMEERFTAERGRELYEDFAAFETSRGYLDVCRRMLAEKNPRQVAESYLGQSEELSQRFIAMSRRHILAAAEAVNEVRSALSEVAVASPETANPEALQQQLQGARAALRAFVDGVSKTASFAVRDEILEEARALHERLRVFEFPDNAVRNSALRNRKIFTLAELFKDAESLLRKVDDAGVTAQATQKLFSGGPDGIREDVRWRSNEHRTTRLGAIHEQGGIAVGKGMLEALDGQATREKLIQAHDWAFLGYSMIRSPLTGDVVSKPPESEEDDTSETLKSWLLGQIEEGRKELRSTRRLGPYEKVTDEFFGAFSDFVRY